MERCGNLQLPCVRERVLWWTTRWCNQPCVRGQFHWHLCFKFAQWWADWSNYSSENGVSLQIAVFIYSRTAVFISTFYSRKSELFLKKGGVILSDLATRLHCIISSPGAISDCTARSFTCYCRFCVLQQLISVHFLMLINTSVNAFLRVAA